MRFAVLLLAGAAACSAQTRTLRVYSELTRIGSDGEIVRVDRGRTPRTILSPGVIRGAWASFRIMVEPPTPGKITLDIGQNPEGTFKPELYLEEFGPGGIPDQLTKVAIPYEGSLPADQKVLTFWLDLWVPATAPVARIKVEPQLWFANDWFVYPMEVRVLSRVAGEVKATEGALPGAAERSDSSVIGPVRAAYCGTPEKAEAANGARTARRLLRRNTFQHLALARTKERLREALTAAGAADICTGVPEAGPEWYLRFRDYLFGREN